LVYDHRPRPTRIAAVRRFNRFYTRRIGVLRKTFLDSPYSLAEARVLYEIANSHSTTATEIGRKLDLDAGYLSRTLRNFEKRGLIVRRHPRATRDKAILSFRRAAVGRSLRWSGVRCAMPE
jgi:DNA-binding MarR family transcriptional regulator